MGIGQQDVRASEARLSGLATPSMPDAVQPCQRPIGNACHLGARFYDPSLLSGLAARQAGATGCRMSDDTANLILALATENAELRVALAEAQDLLVETAVDAGELHARVEELQGELAEMRVERDAWRARTERRAVTSYG